MKAIPMPHRVLMVLDHKMRRLAEEALEASDWRREWASTAAEGLSRLGRHRFEAVLTQTELPDSTGRELLQEVHSVRSEIPVLFLGSAGSEKEVALALERGAAGYALAGPGLQFLLPAALEQAVNLGRSRELERRGRNLQHRNELGSLCLALRHELNNPLTGILGNAEMELARSNLPAPLEHRFQNIVRMAEQIRDVLRDLEQFPDKQETLSADEAKDTDDLPHLRTSFIR